MSYTDPANIRDHVVKIRLNDREAELIQAWVNYTGEQKAVLLREMLLKQAHIDMGMDFMGFSPSAEAAQTSLPARLAKAPLSLQLKAPMSNVRRTRNIAVPATSPSRLGRAARNQGRAGQAAYTHQRPSGGVLNTQMTGGLSSGLPY